MFYVSLTGAVLFYVAWISTLVARISLDLVQGVWLASRFKKPDSRVLAGHPLWSEALGALVEISPVSSHHVDWGTLNFRLSIRRSDN